MLGACPLRSGSVPPFLRPAGTTAHRRIDDKQKASSDTCSADIRSARLRFRIEHVSVDFPPQIRHHGSIEHRFGGWSAGVGCDADALGVTSDYLLDAFLTKKQL